MLIDWLLDFINEIGAAGFVVVVWALIWGRRVRPTLRDRNGWPEWSVDEDEYKRWQQRTGRK